MLRTLSIKEFPDISFDVAKCNKEGQVLPKLDQLGLKAVLKSGWFQSFPQLVTKLMASPNLLVVLGSPQNPTSSVVGKLHTYL